MLTIATFQDGELHGNKTISSYIGVCEADTLDRTYIKYLVATYV